MQLLTAYEVLAMKAVRAKRYAALGGSIGALLALIALILAAPLANSAHAKLDPAPGRAFLTGQLIVAAPVIEDPRFRQTVILIVRHDWRTALADASLIFDADHERLWEAAMERRLQDL
jgi:hypothetical protein